MSDKTSRKYPLKVLYTGAVKDLSGYAAAARDYIRALDTVGMDVSIDARSFEPRNQRLVGEVLERNLWSMISKPNDAHLHIIHLTPDNYKDYANNNKERIGYFAWETSRLPSAWVAPINNICREVWVPCNYLKQVSIQSGVIRPVHVVPHVVPLLPEDWKSSCTIQGLPNDRFKFYSIAQWSERKNILGLLRAYYQEFDKSDPVIFVLKTYRVGNDRSERNFIRREISRLKRETRGVGCPPILLIEEFLGTSEIQEIHNSCDCYVSMARSEGFGLPSFESAAIGNPVIVPRYSAFPEFFTDETSYLVDVPREVPVKDMRHISILYTGDMVWGDPSVEDCQRQMREIFNNQEAAKQKGLMAKQWIKENLSYEAIGRLMKGHIERINKELSNE
jgi:glycosyltransferase involved in cell wall biosynthesis